MTLMDYINALRAEEISRILSRYGDLFRGKDLLEIGSGTGAQLRLLAEVCRSAVGIEVGGSQYAPYKLAEIQQYDGKHIPFPDASFDIIFSSNVIEHIRDEETIHGEMHRVLRPGGIAVHTVPTHHWRLWTSIIHYPNLIRKIARRLRPGDKSDSTKPFAALPPKSWSRRLGNILVSEHHGEFGNRFTEYYHFHPDSWRRRFEKHGWCVETVEPLGLAYEGNCLLAERVSMNTRAFWARLLGSASVLLIMRPRRRDDRAGLPPIPGSVASQARDGHTVE
jgi:SAM-dependent methyltransferase